MKWKFCATAAACWALAGSAQAALFDRGGGMVYDSTLNITWLQDWNQAKTSGFDADGRMDWMTANQWANGLVFGGYDDWRLPTMLDTGTPGCNYSYVGGTDCGYNVQTASGGTVFSEMAHLFFVTLGNKSLCSPTTSTVSTCDPQSGFGLVNRGLFTNTQSSAFWSGTSYASTAGSAWSFSMNIGAQDRDLQSAENFALAVRFGDVTAVPEPSPAALWLVGVLALTAARRRP